MLAPLYFLMVPSAYETSYFCTMMRYGRCRKRLYGAIAETTFLFRLLNVDFGETFND